MGVYVILCVIALIAYYIIELFRAYQTTYVYLVIIKKCN